MATLYRITNVNDNLAIANEEEVEPKNGSDFTLEELQGFVEGYIEIVYLDDDRIMVINEEGKLNDLPLNIPATIEYQRAYGAYDVIVGNALVCKSINIM